MVLRHLAEKIYSTLSTFQRWLKCTCLKNITETAIASSPFYLPIYLSYKMQHGIDAKHKNNNGKY